MQKLNTMTTQEHIKIPWLFHDFFQNILYSMTKIKIPWHFHDFYLTCKHCELFTDIHNMLFVLWGGKLLMLIKMTQKGQEIIKEHRIMHKLLKVSMMHIQYCCKCKHLNKVMMINWPPQHLLILNRDIHNHNTGNNDNSAKDLV